MRELPSDSANEFAVEISSVGVSVGIVTASITAHTPLAIVGEGIRVHLTLEAADMQRPIMVTFMKQLCALMPQTMRDEMLHVPSHVALVGGSTRRETP